MVQESLPQSWTLPKCMFMEQKLDMRTLGMLGWVVVPRYCFSLTLQVKRWAHANLTRTGQFLEEMAVVQVPNDGKGLVYLLFFLAPSVPPLQVSMQVSTRHLGHEKRRPRRLCWIYSNLTGQTHQTIWVNYNISPTWMVRPFGDDFPH